MEPGAILLPGQLWELSLRWYAPRLNPDYEGRSREQVLEIFEAVGLVGPFWRFE